MIKIHVIDPPRHFNPRNLETDLKCLLGRDLSVQIVVANPPQFKMIPEPWLRGQLDLNIHPAPNGILAATKETAARLPESAFDDMTVAVMDDRGNIVKLAGPVSDPVDHFNADGRSERGLKVVLLEHPPKFKDHCLVESIRERLGQPDLKVEIGALCLPSSDPNQVLDAGWIADKAEAVGTSLLAASTDFCLKNLGTVPANISILRLDEHGCLDAPTFAGAILQPDRRDPAIDRNFRKMRLCRDLRRTLAELGIRF